jgi:hypothetical protein
MPSYFNHTTNYVMKMHTSSCVLLPLTKLEVFLVLPLEHGMTDTAWQGDKKSSVCCVRLDGQ